MKTKISILILTAFIFVISLTTFSLYQKTKDHRVIMPENIIARKSQAPNQYRVLAPFLYALMNSFSGDPDWSDRIVQLFSIIFCYLSTSLLFYSSSRSLTLTMIAQIALLGAFTYGMQWKYRQEFFEVGFISLLFFSTYRKNINWSYLIVITILGTLNRETFVFGLTGVAICLMFNKECDTGVSKRRKLASISILFLIYFAIFVLLRYYYGLSPYHGSFWMYSKNLRNLVEPRSVLYMGSGILLVYLISLINGNRSYTHFIFGYLLSFLSVSFLISSWAEHRVFYPIYPLILASLLRDSASQND